MRAAARLFAVSIAFLLVSFPAPAQTAPPVARKLSPNAIHLDVVVTGQSGAPVAGLSQSAFTLLDNGVPQKITAFQPMTGDACPVEVTIVIDTVNPNYSTVAFERQQMDKFFQADGGKLPYLTTLAIFSDNGTQIMRGFTQDGAALSRVLSQQVFSLRAVGRSAGIDGAGERLDWSLRLLRQLIAAEGRLPGRKIVLWMSPGWPFLSGPDVDLSAREERGLFSEIEYFSTELRRSRMTLYAIDPRGTSGLSANYYLNFLGPVRKLNQVQFGNLSLQALAVHSGGLALCCNNNIVALMRKAVRDVSYFYEISYTPPAGEPDEYHSIRVKLSRPDLTARTTVGYYAAY